MSISVSRPRRQWSYDLGRQQPNDRLEEDNDGDDENSGFDEDEIYYPVFCVADVPSEFFEEFDYYAGNNDVSDVPWIEITTSDGPAVLDDLRQNASNDGPSPMPFRDWSIPRIYDFYKAHLRPASDGSEPTHFTYFTFFVIDEECVQSDVPKCIVCTDAPDFGEADDEVTLKWFHIPIAEVMPSMAALEMLSITPSEVRDQSEFCLKVSPQPMLISDPENPGLFQLATPDQGRRNKRAGIRMAEDLDRLETRTLSFQDA